MQLEDSLDVTIDEDDLGDVRTVGDAVDLILAASAANASVTDMTDPAGPGPGPPTTGATPRRRHRHGGQGPRRPDRRRDAGVTDGAARRRAGHAVRRLRAVGRLRLRGHRVRPRALRRAEGGSPHRPRGAARHRRLERRPGRGHRDGPFGVEPVRCGVVAGSGIGGIRTLEQQILTYAEKGPSKVGPFLVPMMMANATAALIGIRNGFTGPNTAVATARDRRQRHRRGARLVRDGMADVVVAGGAEACVTPVTMAAFARMGALSRNADPPRPAPSTTTATGS